MARGDPSCCLDRFLLTVAVPMDEAFNKLACCLSYTAASNFFLFVGAVDHTTVPGVLDQQFK